MKFWSLSGKADRPASRPGTSGADRDRQCSFCRKSSADVSKMIASPSDVAKTYICDECVQVCASILEDKGIQVGHPVAIQPGPDASPLLTHPLAPRLLSLIEVWIRQESSGENAAEELAEVRSLALRMIALG